MNYYEAQEAVRQAAPDERIGMAEIVLMQEFLFVWNKNRRPGHLDPEQWKTVIQGAMKWMARGAVYNAFKRLLGAGWLSSSYSGRVVARVAIGAAIQSTTWTEEEIPSPPHGLASPPHGLASPPHGLASPPHGLPYYVQGTEEEVQELQDARKSAREEGEGGVLGDEALSYARLIPMFEAVFERSLSREALRQLAGYSREYLEPIAAYYSAPPGDDERRYRRRSFEALMANMDQEHDRAVCWLRSEAAKPYRPRRDLQEWKDAIRAVPETLLPAEWRELWEIHMREDCRPWAEIGPRSRQAFLACITSGGMVNRALAETNPTVARYYVRRWLRQKGSAA